MDTGWRKKMFKKIRRKFSFLVTSVTFVVLFLIVLILNVSNSVVTENRLYQNASFTFRLEKDQGKPPLDKPSFGARYFFVEKKDGTYQFSGYDAHYYPDGEIKDVTDRIFASDRDHGFVQYLYYYKESDKAVVIDSRSDYESLRATLWISVSVSLSAFVLISLSSVLLSRIVVKPYEKLYQSQRRFLTDASHELKTPISILSANLEILEKKIGKDDKWLSSSQIQVKRMKNLVQELVTLNKVEEMAKSLVREPFDIAADLMEACDFYSSIAMKKNIEVETAIQEHVTFVGDESMILKLFGILLDNAFKYVSENGFVFVSLKEEKKKIILLFQNSSDTLDEEKIQHCFERFYTVDESHSHQNGGFGIGLAIAKAMVEKMDSSIEARVNNQKKAVEFEIVLKNS